MGSRCLLVVNDFTEYKFSSALFYEKGIKKYEKRVSINDARPDGAVGRALNNVIPRSPNAQTSAMKTPA